MNSFLLDQVKAAAPGLAMPAVQSKARAASMPACDVDQVSRLWKESHSVRRVAVRSDRLFESPRKAVEGEEKIPVKLCIKDAIHNQNVLIPILHRMASHPKHPLPYLKPLAHESHSCARIILSL